MIDENVWKKAIQIYAEFSELSVAEALQKLNSMEALDEQVNAAVITLINSGNEASQYFDEKITPHFNMLQANVKDYELGEVLDEYELVERIGKGGMSQVFKAIRVNSEQQKPVAIKIFTPQDNAPVLLDYFINEQKILSGLNHPHIVELLHGAKTNENTAYLVMELIENATPIDQYCEKNKLTVKQKISYIADAANALAYSHANLIIHRDLKPSNILINQHKLLKIIDFGIAKLVSNDVINNKTTILALTPSYASPEQINSKNVSVQTDVFSLAVVALDLLTDDDPLPQDRLIKSCINDDEYLDQLFKSLKIDKDLKNVLHKALKQEPEARYSSMQSFVDDLRNWLDNKPVNATSQSVFYRMKKYASRHSIVFFSLISVLATLISGLLVTLWQNNQIKIEVQKSQEVKQFMLDAFAVNDPNFSKGITVTAEDILNLASKKLLSNDALDPEVKFELLQTVGIAYGQIGFSKKGAEFLRRSLEIKPGESRSTAFFLKSLYHGELMSELKERLADLDVEKLSSKIDQSRVYRLKGEILATESKFSEAKPLLEKALALSYQQESHDDILLSNLELANLYYLQAETEKAITLLKNILAQPGLDQTNTHVMRMKTDLGKFYYRLGKHDDVIEVLSALEIQQRNILGDDHPELGLTLSQLADANGAKGQLKAAQNLSEESYQIYSNRFGKNSIKSGAVLNSLAILHYQNGDTPKAIELMYEVANIYETNRSPEFADTLAVKTNLASLLSFENRNEESVKIAREVYDAQLKTLGPKNDSTIYTQVVLAISLSKIEKLEEAIVLAKSANKNAMEYLGIEHPTTADTLTALGKIYKHRKEYESAVANFLILIDKQLHKPTSPKYPTILTDIAQLYALLEKNELSESYYLKAIDNYTEIYKRNHKQALLSQIRYAQFLKDSGQSSKLNKRIEMIKSVIDEEDIDNKDVLEAFEILLK